MARASRRKCTSQLIWSSDDNKELKTEPPQRSWRDATIRDAEKASEAEGKAEEVVLLLDETVVAPRKTCRDLCLMGVSILVILIVATPGILLEFRVFDFRPARRGFFCGDQDISRPYKESTINVPAMLAICLTAVAVLVPLAEVLRACGTHGDVSAWRRYGLRGRKGHIYAVGVPILIVDLIYGLLAYTSGAMVVGSLTVVGKYAMGRLRPHFFDVCQPILTIDGREFDCVASGDNGTVYHENYECRGNVKLFPDPHERRAALRNSRLSFPSGHSSAVAATMFYVALYMQARLAGRNGPTWARRTFAVPLVGASLIIVAFYVCLTRVDDHKHHATDVIGGALIGLVVQGVNVVWVMRLFDK